MGARSKDDILPPNVMTPLENGMTAGSTPDLDKMRSEFYELRGIDANGIPKKEALVNAGLADLADRLHGSA
jgi:aldehyde:ferredoxin oxidoreductase